MGYLLVAYPELDKADWEWIQSYRAQNDELYYSVVDPHITFVFNVRDFSEEDFVAEAARRLKDVEPFAFTLDHAIIQDHAGAYVDEFLVPTANYQHMIDLRDHLYSGAFAPYHSTDPASQNFMPHIGIGNSGELATSQKRVDELNARGFSIPGTVDRFEVIEYRGRTAPVRTVAEFPLKRS